ncbi:MAG: phenylalanine--tRNA ligase subunit beta, partial [Candidatus Gracilibacteria bacterium]|nr:phenylalanine--tRNA ligase subunit beta [Candidatus Gracilibacteria bacterium]
TVKYDIVDITNWLLVEFGQPTHAFDADKIEGSITVRQALNGEKINALNGDTYELKDSDIVIADDKKILAIAGIMGGIDSAVTETTKNVCFEIATFDATTVRLTATRIGLRTDASARYEKSLDPLLNKPAFYRIIDLMKFLGKNSTISGKSEYIDTNKINKIEIEVSFEFINRKLGKEISVETCKKILSKLGFEIIKESEKSLTLKVPSWRATKDISIKEDIVEEIGRIYGYENIEEKAIFGPFEVASKNKDIEIKNKIVNYFSGTGFFEVCNYSFSGEEIDKKLLFENTSNAVRIENAFNVDFSIMRRNLFCSLMPNIVENQKISDAFSFFEIGKKFEKLAENKFTEILSIAGFSYGKDFEFIKSSLDGFLKTLIPGIKFEVIQGLDNQFFHPNKSGKYIINGKNIINFGYINPEIALNFDFDDTKTILFEVDYEILKEFYLVNEGLFKEFSRFPGIPRELNFVFDKKRSIGEVIKLIENQSDLIQSIDVIDIYEDENKIGINKKSITFSLFLQDLEKTITDKDALKVQEKIIANLEKEGIILRN